MRAKSVWFSDSWWQNEASLTNTVLRLSLSIRRTYTRNSTGLRSLFRLHRRVGRRVRPEAVGDKWLAAHLDLRSDFVCARPTNCVVMKDERAAEMQASENYSPPFW
jgi:hypothetical protein